MVTKKKLNSFAVNIKNAFLRALYPENITCINCGTELVSDTRYSFCSKCLNELPILSNNICLICGTEINNEAMYCINCMNYDHFYEKNRSLLKYEGLAVSLIKRFKFGNKRYIAEEFGKMLADEYLKAEYCCDLIIPVPMSISEYKERGFNQSALLAKEVAKRLNVAYSENLIKVRDTSTQKHLKGIERRKNLKSVFSVCDKAELKGKTILLIDDVFTTGATINECSRTLKKATARAVYSLTVCVTQFKLHGETSENDMTKTAIKA